VVVTLVAWLFVVLVVETVDLICVFMLVAVAVTVGTDTAFMFVTSFRFTYGMMGNDGCDGMRNDGCDGSSSENECNGKFDLNHFEY
jgi:hypothetical protein